MGVLIGDLCHILSCGRPGDVIEHGTDHQYCELSQGVGEVTVEGWGGVSKQI